MSVPALEGTPLDGPVLVTGGSSGLGAAVVSAVAKRGGRPVVLDRQAPAEPAGRARLRPGRPRRPCRGAAPPSTGGRAGRAAVRRRHRCRHRRLRAARRRARWTRGCGCIAVNLVGTAAVVRAALPHLRANRGRVVTVASTLGIRAVSDATAYCASKFGVVGFTRALAAETAGEVGVTLLVPGGMTTHFFDDRTEQYKPGPGRRPQRPGARSPRRSSSRCRQPARCELRELVVAVSTESSWP